ncbi:glycosyltransferase family 2 protein [Rhizobium sp. BK251]|uniref:glycosyltransferase family 2 protein n=1 Tax=Rhizobium sp. BK251 TaxID=2512125 RepID=UPI00104F722F|nr:glycosyltransferase family 2 protein [Rhizobium sp. BK251]TCL70392.1 undecaprenyl-phosphate 4-deoxy-4-formamido-L-arabinose transferase [Rhizobium sp. BK251]
MGSDHSCKISVVIPAYGSELILPELVNKLEDVFGELQGVYKDYEIIIVCDRSPDNTWSVIRALSAQRPRVYGILLRMNAGQHNALMAGLAEARGEIVVTMDDDLQHSPEDIPKLIEKIEQGFDVAYARFRSRNHPLWKIAGSRLNNIVAGYLMRKPADLYLSPFRAMKSAIRDDILTYSGPYVYVDGLILSFTRDIASVDVDHHERFAGSSRYGLRKSVSLWLKMATSFSLVPLRLTSILGLIVSGLGFILALILIIRKLTLDTVPVGWSSLIVTLLIIGGVQLLALGMLGEYLGRVLLTINSRPQYVVAEKVGFEGRSTTERKS